MGTAFDTFSFSLGQGVSERGRSQDRGKCSLPWPLPWFLHNDVILKKLDMRFAQGYDSKGVRFTGVG
jgi:hypothetical protein